ncbi:MAG TPA: VOC family protein [Polyangiaceae bacterium]|nr:VOC family protein [Polyangiaceae bacterium]
MADDIQLLINIDVPDLDVATTFYVDAFGFRVGRRMGGAGVELLGAAVPLYLLPKAAGSRVTEAASAVRTYQRHWTPVHLDIVVSDVDAARARALAAGATPEGEISEHAWGRMARLADLYGHGVCLIQLSARGYDALCDQ